MQAMNLVKLVYMPHQLLEYLATRKKVAIAFNFGIKKKGSRNKFFVCHTNSNCFYIYYLFTSTFRTFFQDKSSLVLSPKISAGKRSQLIFANIFLEIKQ